MECCFRGRSTSPEWSENEIASHSGRLVLSELRRRDICLQFCQISRIPALAGLARKRICLPSIRLHLWDCRHIVRRSPTQDSQNRNRRRSQLWSEWWQLRTGSGCLCSHTGARSDLDHKPQQHGRFRKTEQKAGFSLKSDWHLAAGFPNNAGQGFPDRGPLTRPEPT